MRSSMFRWMSAKEDLGLAKLALSGLGREERHQLRVAGQALEHRIVRQREVVHFHTGIVPGGNVAGAGRPFIHDAFLAEVERRVEIRHAIEQDAGFVGIRRVAGGDVGRGEIADAGDDRLLPLPEDEIGVDEPPAFAVRDVAFAIVHAESVQRIGGLRMFGVEQQRPVGALRLEEALGVQAGTVELGEIILRKQLLALGTLHLPRLLQRVRDPLIHRHRFPAGGAMAVRPHLPGPPDRVAEHEVPQLVVGQLHPRLGGGHERIADGRSPVVLARVGLRAGDQFGREERARHLPTRRVRGGGGRIGTDPGGLRCGGTSRERCLKPAIGLLPSGLGELVRSLERLPGERVRGAVEPVHRLHVLEQAVEVLRAREDGVLSRIPDEQWPRRREREHVLPVERDAGHVRQVEAELGNERGQVRPAFGVGIAAERGEAATGDGRRDARLERSGEQRPVSAVRVPDAPDALRIHHGQRFQIINRPAHVPHHLAHEGPARDACGRTRGCRGKAVCRPGCVRRNR